MLIANHPNWGWGVAFISASLILLADRVFVAKDFYLEGELYYKQEAGAPRIQLIALQTKRVLSMSIRYAFGIIISVAVIHFAEPGILWPEVSQILHREERDRNADTYESIERIASQVDDDIERMNEQLSVSQVSLRDAEERLALLQGLPDSFEISAETQTRVDELRATRNFHLRQVRIFQACAEVERLGEIDQTCPDVRPSGQPGRGSKYRSWMQKAASANDLAKITADELDNLLKAEERHLNQAKKNREAELISASNEVERLRDLVLELERRETVIFDQAGKRITQYSDIVKSQPDFDPSGERGVIRSYNAVEILKKQEMEEGTKQTLTFLKWFLVALESIVFTSRLLGSSQAYSMAMYAKFKSDAEALVSRTA